MNAKIANVWSKAPPTILRDYHRLDFDGYVRESLISIWSNQEDGSITIHTSRDFVVKSAALSTYSAFKWLTIAAA